MGNIFLVAKIKNLIYFGECLKFVIYIYIYFFFFLGGGGVVNGMCWARAYAWRKNESTPLPPMTVA